SETNVSSPLSSNNTTGKQEDDLDVNTDIYSKVVVTVIYIGLFLVGCLGNSITVYTLVQKKTLQNLQSTVHYHLASLAVSDLFILVLCMPIELYNFIWVHNPWAFGNAVCKGYYFLRDACTYATAFNIASLSVERFMAICHPFKAKSIMSRSRTKKLISAIWVASFLLATPMLFIMGQIYVTEVKICTTIVDQSMAKTVLQCVLTICLVFLLALYSLKHSTVISQMFNLHPKDQPASSSCHSLGSASAQPVCQIHHRMFSLTLGCVFWAVVVAFVVCWLPYHIRRLMYCYVTDWTDFLFDFYHYFYMVTNVLFYVSSTVNPVLYNLVSANYRQIFMSTLSYFCLPWRRKRKRPALARHFNSITSNQTFSSNIIKETMY
ncbi:NTR1 protein, partial [Polyodon spathula]|nr:NTR1 protein [Polyodon spathula]